MRAGQRALGAIARLQAVAQHARELAVGARGGAARRISPEAVKERLATRQADRLSCLEANTLVQRCCVYCCCQATARQMT